MKAVEEAQRDILASIARRRTVAVDNGRDRAMIGDVWMEKVVGLGWIVVKGSWLNGTMCFERRCASISSSSQLITTKVLVCVDTLKTNTFVSQR